MSKQNPNQQYYKVGGRSQSDGPDRVHVNENEEKQELRKTDKDARSSKHPAVMRSKRK